MQISRGDAYYREVRRSAYQRTLETLRSLPREDARRKAQFILRQERNTVSISAAHDAAQDFLGWLALKPQRQISVRPREDYRVQHGYNSIREVIVTIPEDKLHEWAVTTYKTIKKSIERYAVGQRIALKEIILRQKPPCSSCGGQTRISTSTNRTTYVLECASCGAQHKIRKEDAWNRQKP